MKVTRDFIFDPGLVLYLPFYELDGGSLMSKDAYGHLATVTGASWGTNGRTFDGIDDRIDIAASSALQMGTGDWSADAWVKLHPTQTGYPGVIVFDGDGIWILTGEFGLMQDSNVVKFSGGVSATDVWLHIGATRTGTTYNVYKNGVDVSSTGSSPGWEQAGVYALGPTYATYRFKGTIGEVRVYNRALSALEIQQNYLATKWRYQ